MDDSTVLNFARLKKEFEVKRRWLVAKWSE
jgi:hypothetical protein